MGWTQTRSKIASTIRDNPGADVTDLRRQLRAERLVEHVEKVVNIDPPLTAKQRSMVAAALRRHA